MESMKPYVRRQTYEAVQLTKELLDELIAAYAHPYGVSALVREFWDGYSGYIDQEQLRVYDESGEHSDAAEEGGWLVREQSEWGVCNYVYISAADFQQQFNPAE